MPMSVGICDILYNRIQFLLGGHIKLTASDDLGDPWTCSILSRCCISLRFYKQKEMLIVTGHVKLKI